MSKGVYRLRDIVRRETDSINERRRPHQHDGISDAQRQDALVSKLTQSYIPPGDMRENGARHDNDFDAITDIRIAPTQQELTCPLDPYLPPFVPGSPHHLPASSVQKHLDIQFRLLREELMYVISCLCSMTEVNWFIICIVPRLVKLLTKCYRTSMIYALLQVAGVMAVMCRPCLPIYSSSKEVPTSQAAKIPSSFTSILMSNSMRRRPNVEISQLGCE